MTSISKNDFKNSCPNWNEILHTKESCRNYLSFRVHELTNQIQDQPQTLEKTSACYRVVWVAKIVYHLGGTVVFSLAKIFSKMCRASDLYNRCQVRFFNHGTKLYALVKALSCSNQLLVKTHNGFNLNRSNISLKNDLKYNGKPFHLSETKGNCFGSSYLFYLLYLEGKKKFPNLSDRELLIKIAQFTKEGALPEASIFQFIPDNDTIEHLLSFYPTNENLFKTRPENRHLERIDIMDFEAEKTSSQGVEKLKMLRVGVPYSLTTRTWITGRLHNTLVIRAAEEEFYWFDPSCGLRAFTGEAEMKKLLILWEFGTQQKCEKAAINQAQKRIDGLTDDFIQRHNLDAPEIKVVKELTEHIKEGKSWNEIQSIPGVKDHEQLAQHYFETYREDVNRLQKVHFDYGKPKGVFLTPMEHQVIGKVLAKSQSVRCYYWNENRKDEPYKCPVLDIL